MSDQPRPTPDVFRHHLKTWPQYFAAINSGKKTFEIRKNDRDFRVGQWLMLQWFDPDTQEYNGQFIERRISYITDFEQKPGFVVLGLEAESDAREERVRELEAQLDNAEAALGKAHIEANALALSIYRAEYADKAPGWHPLDDVSGLIGQIDNMYAGVRQQRDEAKSENAKLREALRRANEQGRLTHRAYLCNQGISEGDAAMEANRIFPDCQALAGKEAQDV